MAALVFRIPKKGDAATFAAGLRAPFAGRRRFRPVRRPEHSRRPRVLRADRHAGARRRADRGLPVRPVRFDDRAGIVGVGIESGRPQPVPGHRGELSTVRGPSPRGSWWARPMCIRRPARPVNAAAPTGGMSVGTVVALVAAVADRLRRGRARAGSGPAGGDRWRQPPLDPWGPGGIFEAFGATTPTDSTGRTVSPAFPSSIRRQGPRPGWCPALVSAPSSGPSDDPPAGSEWTGSGRGRAGHRDSSRTDDRKECVCDPRSLRWMRQASSPLSATGRHPPQETVWPRSSSA